MKGARSGYISHHLEPSLFRSFENPPIVALCNTLKVSHLTIDKLLPLSVLILSPRLNNLPVSSIPAVAMHIICRSPPLPFIKEWLVAHTIFHWPTPTVLHKLCTNSTSPQLQHYSKMEPNHQAQFVGNESHMNKLFEFVRVLPHFVSQVLNSLVPRFTISSRETLRGIPLVVQPGTTQPDLSSWSIIMGGLGLKKRARTWYERAGH